jgi:hypothetical protein
MNPVPAVHLSAHEHIAEIAEILAAGLMRLHARKSSPFSASTGDSSLDCPARQSGHAASLPFLGDRR